LLDVQDFRRRKRGGRLQPGELYHIHRRHANGQEGVMPWIQLSLDDQKASRACVMSKLKVVGMDYQFLVCRQLTLLPQMGLFSWGSSRRTHQGQRCASAFQRAFTAVIGRIRIIDLSRTNMALLALRPTAKIYGPLGNTLNIQGVYCVRSL
jgi:hypothetical protein